MKFDINAARSAGYSDDEIAEYLATENKFDLGGALQSGYTSAEVVNFLAKPAAAPAPVTDTGDEAERLAARYPAPEKPGLIQRVAEATRPADPFGIASGKPLAKPKPLSGSVLEGAVMPEPAPLIERRGAPVTAEQYQKFKNQYDAASPEERAKLVEADGAAGSVYRAIDGNYKNFEASNPVPTVRRLDTRREARRDALISQGLEGKSADAMAASDAAAGAAPRQLASVRPSDFDFDTKAEYERPQGRLQIDEAGGLLGARTISPSGLDDAMAAGKAIGGKVSNQFRSAAAGAWQMIGDALESTGDITGSDQLSQIGGRLSSGNQAQQQAAKRKLSAIGDNPSKALAFVEDGVSGAVTSIAPFFVGGPAIGMAAVVGQTLADEYGTGKAAGLDAASALGRASMMATAEYIGERISLPTPMFDAFKNMAKGLSVDDIMPAFARYLVKENMAEQVTSAMNFATDKWTPFGLTPNATLEDYLKVVGQTFYQTTAQTLAMGGAGRVIAAGARKLQGDQPAKLPSAEQMMRDREFLVPTQTTAAAEPVAPQTVNFTPADSPSAQAGLAPIVVPVPTDSTPIASDEPLVLPPINPATEQQFGLDKLRMGSTNVSTTGGTGAAASVGGVAGGTELGRSLDTAGLGVAGAGLQLGGDAAVDAGTAGAPVAAGAGAGQRPAGLTRPLERASDADLLARTEAALAAQENNNADIAQPTEQWFGRKGDGYITQADAEQALPGRKRKFSALDWSVEQMPNGKFRLAGYEQQSSQPAPSVGATQEGAGVSQPTQAAPVAEPITTPSGTPFSTEKTAAVYAQQNGITGYSTVKMDGGWAIVPRNESNVQVSAETGSAATAGGGLPTAGAASGSMETTGLNAPTQEIVSGTQAPQAVQGQAQGQEVPAVPGQQPTAGVLRNAPAGASVVSQQIREQFQPLLTAAKDDTKLNAPPPELEAQVEGLGNALGQVFGITSPVVAFSDPSPDAPNGFAVNGQAFVNTANVNLGVQRTSLHEFTHVVEAIAEADTQAGKTGTAAQKFVQQIYGVFDDVSDDFKRAYVESYLHAEDLENLKGAEREAAIQKYLASTKLRSEIVADFMGNRGSDRAFFKDLAAKDPQGFESFVKKWITLIDDLVKSLRGTARQDRSAQAAVDRAVKDLAKAKMVARDALIAFRKGTLAEQQAETVPAEADGSAGDVQELTPTAGPGRVPTDYVTDLVRDIELGEQALAQIKGVNLYSNLGKLRLTASDWKEIKVLPSFARGGKNASSLSDRVSDGSFDDFLPYEMRHDSTRFDEQESTEYIKDALRAWTKGGVFYQYDVQVEMRQIESQIAELQDQLNQEYELEDINNELQRLAEELAQESAGLVAEQEGAVGGAVEAEGSGPQERLKAKIASNQRDKQAGTPASKIDTTDLQGRKATSWVAVSKETGEAVREIQLQSIAEKVNTDKYDVIPVGKYLASLNKKGADSTLSAQTPAEITAKQEREAKAAEADQREQIRKESEAGAGQFTLTGEDGRQDSTGDLFRLSKRQKADEYPLAPRGEWYGEGTFRENGGRMVYMTPDEYIASVRPLTMDDESRENIDLLKEHIQSGKTLDPLLIRANGKEDGRHRAYAAKELGIQRVPVIVYGDRFADAPEVRLSKRQTDTPAFKRWFGESKVVDENGEPLVVYHGTLADFSTFTKVADADFGHGYYFATDPKNSEAWASRQLVQQEDGSFSRSTDGLNVMPVYLALKNPADYRQVTAAKRALGADWTPQELTSELKKRGFDGVWSPEDDEIVAFNPEQIKSATGNDGNFDPANPDIRRSKRQKLVGTTYEMESSNRRDAARIRLQDDALRMKRVIEAVKAKNGKVTDAQNFYDANTLMPGRIQAAIDDFKNEVVRPMLDKAAEYGIDMDELSVYAYAKHAKERNAYIASINKSMPDGGSGMSNAEADDVLQLADLSGDRAKFEELHQMLMAITATTRQVMLNEGLITQDEFDAMENAYQNYIPLRGFEDVDEETGVARPGIGRGINVRGAETIRALGRKSKAGDLIENVIRDYERTISRVEKNDVAKVLLDFVLSNPDPTLWGVDVERSKAAFNKTLGVVQYTKQVEKGEDTIGLKVGGQQVYIKFADKQLTRALRQAWKDETSGLERATLYVAGWWNNWMRAVITKYNPLFAVVNIVRDSLWSGPVAALDTLGVKGTALYAKNYGRAMMASTRQELGVSGTANPVFGNPQVDRMFKEFRAAGGITGGYYMRSLEEINQDMRAELLRAGASPASVKEILKKNLWSQTPLMSEALVAGGMSKAMASRVAAYISASGFFKLLEFAGAASENATRFALYMTSREMGNSTTKAAVLAKDGTTNFNRKGEWGGALNNLFLFFNPAVQGNAQLFKVLKNPKVLTAMAGVTGVGFMLAAHGAAAGGEDDDGEAYWDKIPSYVKERNLVIMLPPGDALGDGIERVGNRGRYHLIPVQYGFNIFPNLGYMMADVMRHQADPKRGVTPTKAALHMTSVVFGSVNPFGGAVDVSDGVQVLLAISPTLSDPLIQLVNERGTFGEPSSPQKLPSDTRPDSERMFTSLEGSASAKIAKALNEMGGGNEGKAGNIMGVETSVAPGTIQTLIGATTGGLGTFLEQVATSVSSMAEGETPKASKIPFLNKFYGEVDEGPNIRSASERMSKVRELASVVQNQKSVDIQPILTAEEEKLLELDSVQKRYFKQLSRLRKEELKIIDDKDQTEAMKKLLRKRLQIERDELATEANREYLKVVPK